MGVWPSKCLTETGKCVEPTAKILCNQDDDERYDDSLTVFVARENTNSNYPIGQQQFGPHRLQHSTAMNGGPHMMPQSASMQSPSYMPPPNPIVLPPIHVRNGGQMQDAHAHGGPMQDSFSYGGGQVHDAYGVQYGRPFEQHKAQNIQSTIRGILGDLLETYPSYMPPPSGGVLSYTAAPNSPLASYTPAPLASYTPAPTPMFGAPEPSGNYSEQMPVLPPTRGSSSSGVQRMQTCDKRFCGECGVPFVDSQKFCSGCGARRSSKPQESVADPNDVDAVLARMGIILGKGSWAENLRWAKGPRREALLVLVTLGIISPRELSDDLTEITQDHIEDCVKIAAEMLVKWPSQFGAPPIQEGKVFFEQRLNKLYMSRSQQPAVYPTSCPLSMTHGSMQEALRPGSMQEALRAPSPSGYYNVLG